MEVVIMLFNYLDYRLAALSTEVDEAYFDYKLKNYILKIKSNDHIYYDKHIKINKIPEIINININNIYPAPNYLKNSDLYNKEKEYINLNAIWGFVYIKHKLIPLVRLELLLSEVICETH